MEDASASNCGVGDLGPYGPITHGQGYLVHEVKNTHGTDKCRVTCDKGYDIWISATRFHKQLYGTFDSSSKNRLLLLTIPKQQRA